MEPRCLKCYCSGPSAKVTKNGKKKIFYLSDCYFCFQILWNNSKSKSLWNQRTLWKPCHAAYLFSVLQSTAFLVMTRSPMAVILNLFHICCSLSPHHQYDLRSLGQDLLINFFNLDVLIGWEPMSYSTFYPLHSKLGQMRELRSTERLNDFLTLTHQQTCLDWTCTVSANSDFIFGWLTFLIWIQIYKLSQ